MVENYQLKNGTKTDPNGNKWADGLLVAGGGGGGGSLQLPKWPYLFVNTPYNVD